MALKSIIYKVDLQANDFDGQHYSQHSFSLARHPSETDERMMVRMLAFAMNADDDLVFGKGLSTEDEPALWRKDLSGRIKLWIDVGLPDLKLVRRAAGRAEQVQLYAYGRTAAAWWQQNRNEFERIAHLSVHQLAVASSQALATLAQRHMQLQYTLQDGAIEVSGEHGAVPVELQTLKAGH
jgi:uncharacterized protein YaeQ